MKHQDQTHYPLTIVVRHGETLSLQYDSRREWLSERTLEQLATQLGLLMEKLIVDARLPVGRIGLSTPSEQVLLEQWSVDATRHPDTIPVHRLIEQQAERSPSATALILDDVRLTYADLNRRANRLAYRLIAEGAKSEVRVGIAMERSVDLIVSILAVLKSGAAYVPLDPQYPAERLSYMMKDSAISLLLTHAPISERIPAAGDVRKLSMEEALRDAPKGRRTREKNPQTNVHPDSLAYVIYTSGSTGLPK